MPSLFTGFGLDVSEVKIYAMVPVKPDADGNKKTVYVTGAVAQKMFDEETHVNDPENTLNKQVVGILKFKDRTWYIPTIEVLDGTEKKEKA